MKLRAKFKDYYGHLWETFFYFCFFLFYPESFELIFQSKLGEIGNTISLIGMSLFCIPSTVLFFRYYYLSNNIEVEINYDECKVKINNSYINLKLEDIQKINVYVPLPVFFNGFRYFATDSYFYAEIILNKDEKLIITTMIDFDLIETKYFFENRVKYEKKWSLICWPPNNTLIKSQ